MDKYTQVNYFSSLINSGYIWVVLGALLLLSFIIVFSVKAYKKYAGKKFSDKTLTILVIGYILSAVMVILPLPLAGSHMNKDRISIKEELIAERYDLNFVEDLRDTAPPYEIFHKVEPRLYKGVASLYSNADKKFYKFSYVFDDEGIFLQENVESKNKSPNDFLKDKPTLIDK